MRRVHVNVNVNVSVNVNGMQGHFARSLWLFLIMVCSQSTRADFSLIAKPRARGTDERGSQSTVLLFVFFFFVHTSLVWIIIFFDVVRVV